MSREKNPPTLGRVASFCSAVLANRMRNGAGSRLPRMQTGYTAQKGSPMAAPTGMPPRSSTTGSIEMQNR